MHSDIDAFAYIHTHFQCCVWYKVHSCAFECILLWLHFLSLLHSRAFIAQDAFMCILCMLHSIHAASQRISTLFNTFSAWCILNVLHSTCDAFRCIIMYSSALRRKNTRFRWAPGRDLTRFMMLKNAHECTWMHMNAQECVRMHQNIHQGPHTYLHKRSRSGLKAKLTWTDMGWTGCGRAIRRAIRAPMCHPSLHRMHTRVSIHEWMHLRTLVNACVSECIWMRLNA